MAGVESRSLLRHNYRAPLALTHLAWIPCALHACVSGNRLFPTHPFVVLLSYCKKTYIPSQFLTVLIGSLFYLTNDICHIVSARLSSLPFACSTRQARIVSGTKELR